MCLPAVALLSLVTAPHVARNALPAQRFGVLNRSCSGEEGKRQDLTPTHEAHTSLTFASPWIIRFTTSFQPITGCSNCCWKAYMNAGMTCSLVAWRSRLQYAQTVIVVANV